MQFYHMTKVLLALYDPPQPSGMDVLELARVVEVRLHPIYNPILLPSYLFHTSKAEIREHTLHICGMIKCLGSRHAGALVNSVGPLVLCKKPPQTSRIVS
jgi:hypothetical protein